MSVKIKMDRYYQGVQYDGVLAPGETYEVDDELGAFLLAGDFGTEVKPKASRSTKRSSKPADAAENAEKAGGEAGN